MNISLVQTRYECADSITLIVCRLIVVRVLIITEWAHLIPALSLEGVSCN
jgi:hypothetical protein